MEEKVYFNDDKIVVTSTLVKCRDNSYAVDKIGSVSMGMIKDRAAGCVRWLLLGGGVFVLIIGLAASQIGLTIMALIWLAVGIFISTQMDKYTQYSVRLNTGGLVEDDIIKSKDKAYIQNIIDSINEAIKDRG